MKEQATLPSVFRLMDDSTLTRAVLELERTCSQPGMRTAPAAIQSAYTDALDRARAEVALRKSI